MTKGELYSLLADAHSRNLLVQVALFALLGHRFVKFPYHAPTAVSRRTELGKLHAVAESDAIMRDAVANDDFGVGYRLRLFSTSMAEERVTLYSTAEFLYQLEAFPPYRYAKGDVRIDVLPGDHVLDCGACYGDTALLFAAKAGERGRVLSFEPHPDIGRLFLHNMKRNPHLAGRMSMMPAATGNTRDGELVLNLCGPGSYLGDGVAVLRKARVPMTLKWSPANGLVWISSKWMWRERSWPRCKARSASCAAAVLNSPSAFTTSRRIFFLSPVSCMVWTLATVFILSTIS